MSGDLESVIADAVSSGGEAESAASTEASAPESAQVFETSAAATEGAPAADTAAPADPDDFDAAPEHVTDSLGRSRENRIPHSAVKRMIEKRLAKAAAEHTAKLSEVERRIAEYDRLGEIMNGDPEHFLRIAAAANPAYLRFLGVQAPPETRQPEPETMPEPDLALADGSRTYSSDGLRRLLEWQGQQVERRMAERFAPITREYETQQAMHQATARVSQQLADAANWPMFTESKADILAALKADQNLSLEAAYRKVVFPKMQSNRDDMRKQLLAELQTAPAATSVPAAGAKASAAKVPQTIEEIIAASVGVKL